LLPLRQLRVHQRVQLMAAASLAFDGRNAQRDLLWEHCRNNLGIARLLLHEGRPEELVNTACRMAVETACRTALEQAGLRFDGDLESSLRRLAAPSDMWELQEAGRAARRLAAAERAVAWIAAFLRTEAPDRTWGF
jgi:hypothetical protein